MRVSLFAFGSTTHDEIINEYRDVCFPLRNHWKIARSQGYAILGNTIEMAYRKFSSVFKEMVG